MQPNSTNRYRYTIGEMYLIEKSVMHRVTTDAIVHVRDVGAAAPNLNSSAHAAGSGVSGSHSHAHHHGSGGGNMRGGGYHAASSSNAASSNGIYARAGGHDMMTRRERMTRDHETFELGMQYEEEHQEKQRKILAEKQEQQKKNPSSSSSTSSPLSGGSGTVGRGGVATTKDSPSPASSSSAGSNAIVSTGIAALATTTSKAPANEVDAMFMGNFDEILSNNLWGGFLDTAAASAPAPPSASLLSAVRLGGEASSANGRKKDDTKDTTSSSTGAHANRFAHEREANAPPSQSHAFFDGMMDTSSGMVRAAQTTTIESTRLNSSNAARALSSGGKGGMDPNATTKSGSTTISTGPVTHPNHASSNASSANTFRHGNHPHHTGGRHHHTHAGSQHHHHHHHSQAHAIPVPASANPAHTTSDSQNGGNYRSQGHVPQRRVGVEGSTGNTNTTTHTNHPPQYPPRNASSNPPKSAAASAAEAVTVAPSGKGITITSQGKGLNVASLQSLLKKP